MSNKVFQKTIFVFVVFFGIKAVSACAATVPQAIQDAIKKKSDELQQVLNQTKETQKQLDVIQNEGKSLQNEISGLDTNIRQVDLGIKSSELTIEKLDLELQSLQYDIAESEQGIWSKKDLIAKTIQEIQKRGIETSLTIFLKGQTLTDSVFELQTLADLNTGLNKSIEELRAEKDTLNKTYDLRTDKKQSKEIENKNLKNKKIILDETKQDRTQILKETKNKEKAYQDLMSALERKQTDIANEIDGLEKELRSALNVKELPIERSGVLVCPLANCLLTQAYGETSFAKKAYKSGFHNGVDLRAPLGTPVYAADDGTIMTTGNNGRVQYGRYVVIRHVNGLATLYAHLSRIDIESGTSVKRGEVIGYSGNTGYSTGPHLHFGVYWAPEVSLKPFAGAGLVPVGPTINPMSYL